jgi:hypothetical protein
MLSPAPTCRPVSASAAAFGNGAQNSPDPSRWRDRAAALRDGLRAGVLKISRSTLIAMIEGRSNRAKLHRSGEQDVHIVCHLKSRRSGARKQG